MTNATLVQVHATNIGPKRTAFYFWGSYVCANFYTFCINRNRNEYSTGYLLIDIITVSHCTSQNVTSDGYILELNMLSFEGKKF